MNEFRQWPDADIDVLVGGTPCQSFSVAGLKKGIEDPRGNLALVYLAIAERYRPTWLVWENVPGVLSTNDGRDFGAIIGGMVELGYCPAWRVLDAQYVRVESHPRAVPQRRRRVFVVGHLGDWRDSAEVLFEPESMRGHPPPRRKKGQAPAGTPGDSSQSGGFIPEVCNALSDGAHNGGGLNGQDADSGRVLPAFRVANALSARMHKGINSNIAEGQTPIVHAQDVADPICANEQRTYTHEGVNNFRTRNVTACFDESQVTSPNNRAPCRGDRTSALAASSKPPSVALERLAVRRLTPRECERLQGFPDDYTRIPKASDSGRYKALGNSMAVPVMRWIGERITAVHDLSMPDSRSRRSA